MSRGSLGLFPPLSHNLWFFAAGFWDNTSCGAVEFFAEETIQSDSFVSIMTTCAPVFEAVNL